MATPNNDYAHIDDSSNIDVSPYTLPLMKFTIFCAMIAQGLFAGLLTDLALKENGWDNPLSRAPIDSLLLAAGIAGKYYLVLYFQTLDDYGPSNMDKINGALNDFLNSASTEGSYSYKALALANNFAKTIANSAWSLRPTNWSKQGWLKFVDTVFTWNASAVFAYLGKLGFDNVADLVLQYGGQSSKNASHLFKLLSFQAWFIFAGGVVNLPSFPNIHRGALATLKGWLDHWTESSAHYHVRTGIEKRMRTALYDFSHAIAVKRYTNAQKIINQLVTQDAESRRSNVLDFYQIHEGFGPANIDNPVASVDIEKLREALIEYATQNPRTESAFSSFFAHKIGPILGLGLMATGPLGFWNFYDIAGGMTKFFSGVPGLGWVSKLSVSAGVMDFLSMGSLAAFIFPSVLNFVKYISGETPGVQVSSPTKRIAIFTFALVVALLGGLPNAYQALVIDNEGAFFSICAELASAFVEIGSFYALFIKDSDQKVLSKDQRMRVAKEISDKLQQVCDLQGASKDEIQALTETPVPEKIASWYSTLTSWCGWHSKPSESAHTSQEHQPIFDGASSSDARSLELN